MWECKLIGEEEASPPRKRLAQLLCYFCVNVEKISTPSDQDDEQRPGREFMEREILLLAKEHPDVFATDLVTQYDSNSERRTPLARIVSFRYKTQKKNSRADHDPLESLLSREVFEAAFQAHPGSLLAVDSWGDTILKDLIKRYPTHYPCSHPDDKKHSWFELVKLMISKDTALLSVESPIINAVAGGLPLDIVQYLIEHHPADPFQASRKDGTNVLAEVVKRSSDYSYEYIEHVFNRNPAAVKARNIGRYSETVLHFACRSAVVQPKIVRLILNGDPTAAFAPARDRDLPLFIVACYFEPRCGKSTETMEMIALANPKAVFTNYKHHKCPRPSSPFSLVYDKVTKEGNHGWEWKHLYFLMNVYRFGNQMELAEMW